PRHSTSTLSLHDALPISEFQDVQRLETLLAALEQRSALYQVLSRTLLDSDSTILIGAENDYEPMQECSIIMTLYRIGSRPAGYLDRNTTRLKSSQRQNMY